LPRIAIVEGSVAVHGSREPDWPTNSLPSSAALASTARASCSLLRIERTARKGEGSTGRPAGGKPSLLAGRLLRRCQTRGIWSKLLPKFRGHWFELGQGEAWERIEAKEREPLHRIERC